MKKNSYCLEDKKNRYLIVDSLVKLELFDSLVIREESFDLKEISSLVRRDLSRIGYHYDYISSLEFTAFVNDRISFFYDSLSTSSLK